MDIDGVPVIHGSKKDGSEECRRAAEALMEVGCLIYDGVDADMHTPSLIKMLERYFRQSPEMKRVDARSDISYQVGWMPGFKETTRPRPEKLARLRPEHLPHPVNGADPKERFMTPIGPRPTTQRFPQFAGEPVKPERFPEWDVFVTPWGVQAHAVMWSIAEMSATGFGLPRNRFTRLLEGGPHLFAPTGSDLRTYGMPGTVLAGWHDDLNFMSVHGKSNFLGLRVWRRDGVPLLVRIPDGCMLVQAGQQFEYLTGGAVLCGMHEVIAVPEMKPGIAAAKREGVVPWRVSTTFFGHVASDNFLEPLDHFGTKEHSTRYPRKRAGTHVQEELDILGFK